MSRKLDNSKIENLVSLTHVQKGMLLQYRRNPQSREYHEQLSLTLEGEIDIHVFQKAWNRVISENEVLRTVYRWDGMENPVGIILKSKEVPVKYLEKEKGENEGELVQRIKEEDLEKRIDLEEESIRVYLLKLGEWKYQMILSNHHIILDGWSSGIIIKELLENYEIMSSGEEPKKRIKTKFAKFLKHVKERDRKEEETYWKGHLKNKDTVEELFTSKESGETIEKEIRLSSQVSQEIRTLARENRISPATVFYGLWSILLQKWSGSNGVIFGTTVSGRPQEIPGIEEMVGLFINTIPMCLSVREEGSFKEHFVKIQNELNRRKAYENSSLIDIREYIDEHTSENMFNSIVVVENYPLDIEGLKGKGLKVLDYSIEERNEFNLTVEVMTFGDMEIKVKYKNRAVPEEMGVRIPGDINKLILSIIEDVNRKISSVSLLSEEEEKKILIDFNHTDRYYPDDLIIQDLFENTVKKDPGEVAVVTDNEELTFSQLNHRANSLARTLREKGVSRDKIVAVMLPRSIDMIVAILAVIKAGGAYLPIGVSSPKSRKEYILEDSGSALLLTKKECSSGIQYGGEIIDVEEPKNYSENCENLEHINLPGDMAYVIYTSGTTGNPKGAVIQHNSLINRLNWMQKEYPIGVGDTILQKTTYTFDVSVWEIFWWGFVGARVCLLQKDGEKDPKKIVECIKKHKVTTMHFVPSMLDAFLFHLEDKGDAELPSLKRVFCSGEALKADQVNRFNGLLKGEADMINLYGPTEATIDVSYYNCPKTHVESVPIGKPIDNIKLYVMRKGELCPIGVPGELHIAGVGLAREYLNRESLTREKFIDNPFKEGEKMYKTGDLVKWGEDGNIQYIDRIDNQVKIRGFRIELQEIEKKLLSLEGVKESAVIAVKNSSGERFICAYVTAATGENIDFWRKSLEESLPYYMVPAHFIHIDKMPLTSNGKLDRRALPKPEKSSGEKYFPPRDEIEEFLVKIWEELLGKSNIGIDDNFFHLGGHSLKITMMISKIKKGLNREITIDNVFESGTIRALGEVLRGKEIETLSEITKAEEKRAYPVTPAQKRVFIVNEMDRESISYNMPALFRIEGEFHRKAIESNFNELINRHQILRTNFREERGEVLQFIREDRTLELQEKEVHLKNEESIQDLFRERVKPFNLEEDMLLRGEILDVEGIPYLFIDMHHIISDGVSQRIIIDEIRNLARGNRLYEPKYQYKDYAQWYGENIIKENMKEAHKYWEDIFKEEITTLNLGENQEKRGNEPTDLGEMWFGLNREIQEGIREVSAESGSSIHMMFTAALNILLWKFTLEEDIIIGTPTSGRGGVVPDNMVGMFVNSIPLRNRPNGKKSFMEFLSEVKENSLKAYKYSHYPVEKMGEEFNLSRSEMDSMFKVMINLMDTATENSMEMGEFSLYRVKMPEITSKFPLTLNVREREGHVSYGFHYNKEMFTEEKMKRMGICFTEILQESLKNPHNALGRTGFLGGDQRELLMNIGKNSAEIGKRKTMVEMFVESVKRFPVRAAVTQGETSLSYRELHQKSNELTEEILQKAKGEQKVVGVLFQRSIEMMISILGVMKSGSPYMPIDPEMPKDRIEYMLKDSGCSCLLGSGELLGKVDFNGEKIIVQKERLKGKENFQYRRRILPQDGAYVIYTSGTTGKPKGVTVKHENLHNFIHAFSRNFKDGLDENEKTLSLTNYAFDVSVCEFFSTLACGGELVLNNSHKTFDPEEISNLIFKYGITFTYIPPALLKSVYRLLKEKEDRCSLRKLLVGVEPIKGDILKAFSKLNGGIEVVNGYGPTETTICSTFYKISGEEDDSEIVPIGRPAGNNKIFIMDDNMNIQPLGAPGEICIGGYGVSKGYLNHEELTHEKFIRSDVVKGEKIYRTGDIARWDDNCNLRFIGRKDHQVKLRGFRIELEEIKSRLLQIKEIEDAVVVLNEREGIGKTIDSYVVSQGDIDAFEIKEELRKNLPEYMIPAFIQSIDGIPLTSRGKVDKDKLPEIEGRLLQEDYVPPRTGEEKIISEAWCEVLGLERVGTRDDFFNLGGDSIKAMEIASKVREKGYKLEVKEVFSKRNIEKLAENLQKQWREREKSFSGEIPLTPIQKMFFENLKEVNHWNQSVIIRSKETINHEAVWKTMSKLFQIHDSMRITFTVERDKINQLNNPKGWENFTVEDCNFKGEGDIATFIEKKCNEIQKTLNIEKGPLVKTAIFRSDHGDYMAFFIHHLIVDGVSWRILLEDFQKIYWSVVKNEETPLVYKTDSLEKWSRCEMEYSKSMPSREKEYWMDIAERGRKEKLLNDKNPKYKGKISEYQKENVILSKEKTEELLLTSNRAYNTETGELLIAALTRAMVKWNRGEELVLGLEGHGREKINEEIDVSRTLGWFTSQYPILLKRNEGDTKNLIIETKEMLRKIPKKGIGFGILKYLGSDEEKDKLSKLNQPVVFNYLGELSHGGEKKGFTLSDISTGENRSSNGEAIWGIEINGTIRNRVLSIEILYNSKRFQRSSMCLLGEYMKESLLEIVDHCKNKEISERTPSDFTSRNITSEELSYLEEGVKAISGGEIQDIYPLTPMQKGMLYHTEVEGETGAYFEQISFKLEGNINLEIINESFKKIVARHEALRSVFFPGDLDKTQQIVLQEIRDVDFRIEEISLMGRSSKEALEKAKSRDREEGFKLQKGNPIRLRAIKFDSGEIYLLWSFHHSIMDGWCTGILMKEFFQIYSALKNGDELLLQEAPSYRNYVEWLMERDYEKAKSYWKNELYDFQGEGGIPSEFQRENHGEIPEEKEELERIIPEELLNRIEEIGKKWGISISTLLQTVWATLLVKVNNAKDVLFGTVVSGRNGRIDGIENMIGLFINTIPLRFTTIEGESFIQGAMRIQEKMVSSQEYHFYPLGEIQGETEQKGDLVRNLFIFENYKNHEQMRDISQGGLKISQIEAFEKTNYDFVTAVKPGKDFKIVFGYNSLKYSSENVERIWNYFMEILAQVALCEELQLKDISVITKEERNELITLGSGEKMDYPLDKTIGQVFKETAEKYGDRIAVCAAGEKLTYRELDEISNGIARKLWGKGLKPGETVGLISKRTVNMIAGIFGILKAQGAYVPIDPSYPEERCRYVLDDSGAEIILAEEEYRESYPKRNVINIESIEGIETLIEEEKKVKDPENPAYVIYTSGSTGKPKGVVINNRSVINLSCALEKEIYSRYEERQRVAMVAPYYFDASVQQIFGALLNGHTLYITSEEARSNGVKLLDFYREHSIEVSDGTPIHLSLIGDVIDHKGCSSLKHMIIGGDVLKKEWAEKILSSIKDVKISNVYGPTECCVDSTIYHLKEADLKGKGEIPIGKPLENSKVYVVGNDGELLPRGIYGELLIGGHGVGKGYMNKRALTEESFVDDSNLGGGKLYRTGDLVRWNNDGNLQFKSRMDNQIKIRGYRIELGEIEAQLGEIEGIDEAVVLGKKYPDKTNYLAAFITGENPPKSEEIREILWDKLPEYMIPSDFVILDHIPLTSNGKINRKTLSEMEIHRRGARVLQKPETRVERELLDIWKEVLNREEIGVGENFFELGGHSLKAASIIGKIHEKMNKEISIKELFRAQNIRKLSRIIEGSSLNVMDKIEKVRGNDVYEVSPPQKRIFMLQEFGEEVTAYNMPFLFRINGKISIEKTIHTLKELFTRHEALRTTFGIENENIFGRVHQGVDIQFAIKIINGDLREQVEKLILPFDMEEGPLFRCCLIEKDGEQFIFMDIHHIISDGLSMEILLKDLREIYRGKKLESPKLQYKDFAYWINNKRNPERENLMREYWKEQFKDEIPVLHMPYDFQRPKVQDFKGDNVYFSVQDDLYKKVKDTAVFIGATPGVVLMGAFNILLSRYSGENDIVVGMPVSGREHEDVKDMVGMFVNTLPIRNKIRGKESVKDFLEGVKDTFINSYENGGLQLEEIIDTLHIQRNTGRNPLFDVMFNMIDGKETEDIRLGEATLEKVDIHSGISKFDLNLTAVDKGDKFTFDMEYACGLFEKETVEGMMGHFKNILKEMLENIQSPIREIEMILPEEKSQILSEFNQKVEWNWRDDTLHGVFQRKCEESPEKIGLIYHNGFMTYGDINKRAEAVAWALRARGIEKEEIVGLRCESSPEMIIGILGILKSGGAYMPMDLTHPKERTDFMIRDSGCRTILSNVEPIETPEGVQFIDIGSCGMREVKEKPIAEASKVDGNNLAYIIYTSGTTGKPKGVMIEHCSALNTLYHLQEKYPLGEKDVYLLKTNYVFDVSVSEIFGWFIGDGALAVLKEEEKRDIKAMAEGVEKFKVTHLNLVPSVLKVFNEIVKIEDISLSKLKYLFSAGEALSPGIAHEFYNLDSNARLENLYGPTEGTVYASGYSVVKEDIQKNIPIGKPLNNTNLFVLKENCLMPIGVEGELCIGGAGVARGYLNREDLNRDKFQKNPFGKGLMYRTGDLVKWNKNGDIEFIKRIDSQVKIRGMRMELREIEWHIEKEAEIDRAVVTVVEDGSEKKLCAYYISSQPVTDEELKEKLERNIPSYMVPDYFVEMEKMPLTGNGKINKKVLPSPFKNETSRVLDKPITEVEKDIANLWKKILKIKEVGAEENFFHLGGNSLNGTIMISRLRALTGRKLSLKDLFTNPTVRQLGEIVHNSKRDKDKGINKLEESEYYETSSAQKRMYMLYEFDRDSTAYNMPLLLKLEGKINVKVLEDYFQKILRKHESLRTTFIMREEDIFQIIHRPFKVKIERASTDINIKKYIRDYLKPFDLEKGPLFRVEIINSQGENYLLIDMHHIISDGFSMKILTDDLERLSIEGNIGELGVQYKDYAAWHNRKMESKELAGAKEYWLSRFQGDIPVLNLPYDYSMPLVQSFEGEELDFNVGIKETEDLRAFSREKGVTLQMTLLSAFYILLMKYSGEEDIVVGIPDAGRDNPQVENLMGIFLNTLALRNTPHGEWSIGKFLREVKQSSLDAYGNNIYQFENLVEELQIKRDTGRNPLFDVLFNMVKEIEVDSLEIEDMRLKQIELENTISKFQITLSVVERSEALKMRIQYCKKLFKRETIMRMSSHYVKILKEISSGENPKIKDIEIMDSSEKEMLVEKFNSNVIPLEKELSLDEIFQKVADEKRDEIAVRAVGESITYGELELKASRIASRLVELGVSKGDAVPILCGRNVNMIAGILGIIKAGGAYLPVDTKNPSERTGFILEDSCARVILTEEDHSEEWGYRGKTILFSSINENIPPLRDRVKAKGESPVYIIYTSGSTGKPKGVVICHRNLMNLVKSLKEEIYHEYSSTLNIALVAPYYFDSSVKQIFLSLTMGETLHIVPEECRNNGHKLVQFFKENNIQISDGTPAHLAMIGEVIEKNHVTSIKHFLVGGEALKKKLAANIMEKISGVKISNLYGPTECCVDATHYLLKEENLHEREEIPIGKPLPNTRCFIRDPYGNLCPLGVYGELCISGEGVALGYMNLPGLTEEKFVPSVIDEKSRMYRTGDIARWLPDGNIQFSSRLDNQLKIRGFRIELGEIERTIEKLEGVAQCAVIAKSTPSGEKILCAFLVSDHHETDKEDIKIHLREVLPEYMIPQHISVTSSLPLTANGKIDKKKLSDIEVNFASEEVYHGARDRIESVVEEIWKDVLKIETPGIKDDFFLLGGNSLSAAIVSGRIQKRFNKEIKLKEFFREPTIEGISRVIRKSSLVAARKIESLGVKESYETSSAQKRIFMMYMLDKKSITYNMPVLFEIKGEISVEKINGVFSELIERHEILRSNFFVRDEEIRQKVHKPYQFHIETTTLDRGIEEILKESVKPFNLEKEPLFRGRLIQSLQGKFLFIDLHHIISDGTSMGLLMKEFIGIYRGEELQWPEIQYRDFSFWQNRSFQEDGFIKKEEYWLNRFEDGIEKLNLPYSVSDKEKGGIVDIGLRGEEWKRLKEIQKKFGLTFHMLMLMAVDILLYKYTGQENITVASPIDGRDNSQLENIMGMFVNIIPLKNTLNDRKKLSDFIKELRVDTLDAYENKEYQYDKLVEKLDLSKDGEVIEVMLNTMEKKSYGAAELGECQLIPWKTSQDNSKFNIGFNLMEKEEGLVGNIQYKDGTLSREDGEDMAKRFEKILGEISQKSGMRIEDIHINNEDEMEYVKELLEESAFEVDFDL